jgi:hypothetical protein
MYYDPDGKMRAAGAEAEGSAIDDVAEDYGWTKAELSVPLLILLIVRTINNATLDSSFDCARKQ